MRSGRIAATTTVVMAALGFVGPDSLQAWNARFSCAVATVYPDGSYALPGYCTHGFLVTSAMAYMGSPWATADERRARAWLGNWACANLCGQGHYLGDFALDSSGVCRKNGTACSAEFHGAGAAAAFLADHAGDADGFTDTQMCRNWPPKDGGWGDCSDSFLGKPWSRLWHAINMGVGWTAARGSNGGYSLRTAFRPWGGDGTYPRDVDYGTGMGDAAVLNACLHPVVRNYQSQSGRSCVDDDWKGFVSGGLANEGFMSVDALGQFWFQKFARGGGTVADLGVSLHAVGDAGQPNHANGTWGNNHGVFEDWMDLNWAGPNHGGVRFDSLEDVCMARAALAQSFTTSAYPGTWTDFDGRSHVGTPARTTRGVDLASTPREIIQKVANWAYGQTDHFDGTETWRFQNSASIVVPTTVAAHVLLITKGVTMHAFGGRSLDDTPPCGARSSEITGRGHLDVFTTRYAPVDPTVDKDVIHKVLYEFDPAQGYNTTPGIGFGRIGWIADWLTDSGGKIRSKLGTASWAYGRQDLFGIGTDGNLHHNWWQGSWGGWHGLGRPGADPISDGADAVSWGPDHLDAYVRVGNSVYRIGWRGAWSPWTLVGGPDAVGSLNVDLTLDGSPVAASTEWGRTDLFVIGQERHTIRAPDGSRTTLTTGAGNSYASSTEGAGPNSLSPPCGAISPGTGHAHRYALHLSNAPTTVTLSTGDSSTDFDTVLYVANPVTREVLGCNDNAGPGVTASTLAVTLRQPGDYDLYVTGAGGASGQYRLRVTSTTGSARRVFHGTGDGVAFTWEPLPYLTGMQFTQFNPLWHNPMDAVATPWSRYRVRLYALATGNAVYEYGWDGKAWVAAGLGGACGSNPTAVSRGRGSIDLLCVGADGKTLYWKRNSGGNVGERQDGWGPWIAVPGTHTVAVSGDLDALSWNQHEPGLVSDASWRVSENAPPSWTSPGFDDTRWAWAVDEGEYGVGPWWTDLVRSNARWWPRLSSARWIWSRDTTGDTGSGPSTCYFRKSFVATKSNYSLSITADDGFTAYLDGVEWTGGISWVRGSTSSTSGAFPVPVVPGRRYTMAVEVRNTGGPAGLLVDLR